MSRHEIPVDTGNVEVLEVRGPDDTAFWDEVMQTDAAGRYAVVIGSLDDVLILVGPLEQLAQVCANLVACILASDPSPAQDAPGWRWSQHSNNIGDWCPWSGVPVTAGVDGDERCPVGCRASRAEWPGKP
ncbi:hypothetical protein [Micromonospora aurantiaca (nom. illeg.)]|uniref:hypothetical protein n=1 Tax=Micromonospora aurantiaca (nom. illeg.) TaxID=47850 RepID=UPI0033ED64F3